MFLYASPPARGYHTPTPIFSDAEAVGRAYWIEPFPGDFYLVGAAVSWNFTDTNDGALSIDEINSIVQYSTKRANGEVNVRYQYENLKTGKWTWTNYLTCYIHP
jgi:hypothetical protein